MLYQLSYARKRTSDGGPTRAAARGAVTRAPAVRSYEITSYRYATTSWSESNWTRKTSLISAAGTVTDTS